MCEYISSYGFFHISHKGEAASWIGHDLIGDENGDIKLFCELDEFAQKPSQVLLPFAELAPARVVHSVQSHDRVHDQKRELVLQHQSAELHQQRAHHLRCVRTTHHDVLQNLLEVQIETFRYAPNSLGPESTLRVDISHLALSSYL